MKSTVFFAHQNKCSLWTWNCLCTVNRHSNRGRLLSYNPRVFTLSWWVLKNLRALEPLDRFALPPPGKSWTFTWNYMNIPRWTCDSIRHTNNFYRPQRSCGKVIMFTSVCQEFCPRGWRWVSASVHAGIHPPPRQTSPRADTPPADGTHPNGMHSCTYNFLW